MPRIKKPKIKTGGRISWNKSMIFSQLKPIIQMLHRMPTHNELKRMGKSKLASAIPRHGGYEYWTRMFGSNSKSCTTTLGRLAEEVIAVDLVQRGFTVERQTVKAPFDLLVDEHRIDVKCSHKNKENYYVFAIKKGKKEHECNFYILCCLDDCDDIIDIYIVPSSIAPYSTLTLSSSNLYNGKYKKYRYAYHLLIED